MASDVKTMDVSGIPELAWLVKAVAASAAPILLRAGDADSALLSPAVVDEPERSDAPDSEILAELERRRRAGMSITDMTAGILKSRALPLSLTIEQTIALEREAFEQGVAEQVMESMRD